MDPVGWWQSRPRVQRWLQRRLPPAREVTLNQRRIFIFLSREGGLYAALLLITFIAGINYANNLILMLCFLLSSVLVVSLHQTYFQLSGLHLELVDPEQDVVSGQSVQVRLRLSGQRAHHELELSTPSQRLVLPRVQQPVEVIWRLEASVARGWMPLPRLTVASRFPLGILRSWSYVHFAGGLWVSPRPQPAPVLRGQGGSTVLQSDSPGGQPGQEEFDQLRAHVPGESLGRISWAHLARGQGLWSKQFIDPETRQDWVDYQAMPGPGHEQKLAQMAHWIDQYAQAGLGYGVRLPGQVLPVGAGPQHQQQALRLLAQSPL